MKRWSSAKLESFQFGDSAKLVKNIIFNWRVRYLIIKCLQRTSLFLSGGSKSPIGPLLKTISVRHIARFWKRTCEWSQCQELIKRIPIIPGQGQLEMAEGREDWSEMANFFKLTLLLLALVGLSACQPDFDFDDVQKGLEDNSIVLVDVRNRDEVQTLGKIPTSHNLPRELLLQTLPIQMTSRVLGS